jgi:hypothetical protein
MMYEIKTPVRQKLNSNNPFAVEYEHSGDIIYNIHVTGWHDVDIDLKKSKEYKAFQEAFTKLAEKDAELKKKHCK